MTATFTFRSRRPRAEVVKILRSLPGILDGTAADIYGLRKIYLTHFAHKLIEIIHEEFIVKSRGQADSLGQSWAPLDPAYVKQRRRKYPSSANFINIRSGALEMSLRPGHVVSGRYFAPDGQAFELTPDGFTYGSTLPYAGAAHAKRPLYPSIKVMRPWTLRAAKHATAQLIEHLTKIL